MKFNYSKRILIVSIITFLLVVILNVIFSQLLLNKIADINNKIKQQEFSSQEREKALSLKSSIQNSVAERVELSEYFVPSGNAETVKFTKALEDLALSLGLVQKKTLNYEAIPEMGSSGNISAIRFKFSVSGKWNSVYNFLQLIETLPKVSRLNSVSLNYIPESKTWSSELDFSVIKLEQKNEN